MLRFIIDENLPKSLNIWSGPEFVHVTAMPELLSDVDVWKFATQNKLIILTQDTDFHIMIRYRTPPPKVVLFKIGNNSITQWQQFLKSNWPDIIEAIESVKLLIVYRNKIEGIK